MKKNSIRKLTIAGVLVAVAVVGSLFSIPVLGAKCSPVQHMVNVLGAVLLGPWYALGMGFAAALIRNVLGCAVWPIRPARSCRSLTLARYSAPAFSAVWLPTRLPHS